jgi:hypothetical protein
MWSARAQVVNLFNNKIVISLRSHKNQVRICKSTSVDNNIYRASEQTGFRSDERFRY